MDRNLLGRRQLLMRCFPWRVKTWRRCGGNGWVREREMKPNPAEVESYAFWMSEEARGCCDEYLTGEIVVGSELGFLK